MSDSSKGNMILDISLKSKNAEPPCISIAPKVVEAELLLSQRPLSQLMLLSGGRKIRCEFCRNRNQATALYMWLIPKRNVSCTELSKTSKLRRLALQVQQPHFDAQSDYDRDRKFESSLGCLLLDARDVV